MNKLIDEKSLNDLFHNGMTIMIGGFMTCGTPFMLVEAVVKSGVRDLTLICTDTGYADKGIGKLISNKQVKKLYASHIGTNKETGTQYSAGEIEIEFCPQGTLAERIRSGGFGLGGVLTKTGIGTIVEEGKQKIVVEGEEYLLETGLRADIALIGGSIVDHFGNVFYNGTTNNFNSIMAMAADKVIVEAEQLVEVGMLKPETIMTTGACVDYILDGR